MRDFEEFNDRQRAEVNTIHWPVARMRSIDEQRMNRVRTCEKSIRLTRFKAFALEQIC